MNLSFELLPPQMPNFISIKMPVGKRQDGMKANGINVEDLTKEQAEEYAELMKQAFIEHWENKTNQTPDPGAAKWERAWSA